MPPAQEDPNRDVQLYNTVFRSLGRAIPVILASLHVLWRGLYGGHVVQIWAMGYLTIIYTVYRKDLQGGGSRMTSNTGNRILRLGVNCGKYSEHSQCALVSYLWLLKRNVGC